MRPQPQFACCLVGLSLLFGAYCPAVAGFRPIQTQSCTQHDAEIAAGKPARRVALSIGVNSPKHGVNNAANDGQLIATTLRELGWEVSQAANVDRVSMLAAIAAFGNIVKTLCPSDVALFYFAGNGFEVNRVSYMGGADAAHERIKQPTSLEDQLSALDTFASTKDVLKVLSEHQGAKFIVLDTCRDNPFEKSRANLEQLAVGALPDNSFFAYASEPGNNAADQGPNPNFGPYAWALSRALRELKGSAEEVFRQVRQDLVKLSADPAFPFDQRPFVESTLSKEVYLGDPPQLRALSAKPTPSTTPQTESGKTVPAERRVALLIGNAAYANQSRLENPVNDIQRVGEVLRGLGFQVFEERNLIYRDFAESLRAFGKVAADADWSLIYYAGHGMEIGGRTYVLPTDTQLEKDVDADDEAVKLDTILEKVERSRGLGLVVLDACRNNPFARSMRVTGRRGRDARTGAGLGRATVDSVGVLVAYSARHGTTADDGVGETSPFAEAFLAEIQRPGMEVNMVFRRVRDRVLAATDRRQEPFIYGSLPGREFYFRDAAPLSTSGASLAR